MGWRLLRHFVPDLRIVVVRRPVEEVVASMLAAVPTGVYDEARLRLNMTRNAAALAEVSALSGVLTIDHWGLDQPDVCAAVWEKCLPSRFDRAWWDDWRTLRVEVDVMSVLRYYHANRDAVEAFKAAAKRELFRLVRAGAITRGVVHA